MTDHAKQAIQSHHPSDLPERDDGGWLDALLREDAHAAAESIADNGFTVGLMHALPPARARARASYRWIVPAMGFLGFVVGFVLLSGGEELSLLLTGLAASRALSLQSLLLALLPLGVLYWIALGAAWQET